MKKKTRKKDIAKYKTVSQFNSKLKKNISYWHKRSYGHKKRNNERKGMGFTRKARNNKERAHFHQLREREKKKVRKGEYIQ